MVAPFARLLLKNAAFWSALLVVFPLVLACRIEVLLLTSSCERVFSFCKELLAAIPTLVGSYLRGAFYWAACTGVARDIGFAYGSMVAHRDVHIGRGSAVGPYTIIGLADIGEDVLIGARVSVLSGKYQHGRPDAPRATGSRAGLTYGRVRVGDRCWIGEQAVVMANLGSACTVGAGSVVARDFGDGVTVLGNPARRVNLEEIGTAAAGAGV